MTPAAAARERVLGEHGETVESVLAAGEAAAAAVEQPAPRDEVVAALAAAMDDALRADVVGLLRGAVDATGRGLQAEPVPAPPYLVVTARGPMVRATLADGRLVVLLRAFRHTEGGYVHADVGLETAVEVRFRRSP